MSAMTHPGTPDRCRQPVRRPYPLSFAFRAPLACIRSTGIRTSTSSGSAQYTRRAPAARDTSPFTRSCTTSSVALSPVCRCVQSTIATPSPSHRSSRTRTAQGPVGVRRRVCLIGVDCRRIAAMQDGCATKRGWAKHLSGSTPATGAADLHLDIVRCRLPEREFAPQDCSQGHGAGVYIRRANHIR